jgi:preprotein translocase subunit SecG
VKVIMAWWAGILLGFYVLACVVLVIAVLLQPGKADAAALFGGGGSSQTAFGPRGAQNFLGWVTIVSAGLFIALALFFALPWVLGPQSVVSGGATPLPAEKPAASTTAPPATPPQNPATPAAGAGQTTPATQNNQAKPEAKSPSTAPKPDAAAPSGTAGKTDKPAEPKKQ